MRWLTFLAGFSNQMYGYLIKGVESSGDNLLGFEYDVYAVLADCEYFSDIEVESTEDPEHLMDASLSYSADVDEAWVVNELTRGWLAELMYSDFETHSHQSHQGIITFNFCTKTNVLGVTVKIVASPSTVFDSDHR